MLCGNNKHIVSIGNSLVLYSLLPVYGNIFVGTSLNNSGLNVNNTNISCYTDVSSLKLTN